MKDSFMEGVCFIPVAGMVELGLFLQLFLDDYRNAPSHFYLGKEKISFILLLSSVRNVHFIFS